MIHGKCGDAIFLKGRTSIDPRHALERCQCVNATPLDPEIAMRAVAAKMHGVSKLHPVLLEKYGGAGVDGFTWQRSNLWLI